MKKIFKHLAQTTICAIPSIIFIVIIAISNPFGIKSASERSSSDVFLHMAAPLYPQTGQSNIAVVIIDDTSLGAEKQQFPPSFRFYGRVVDALAAAGARSILLDFNFIDERGSDQETHDFVASLGQLPIYLTSPEKAVSAPTCKEVTDHNLPVLLAAMKDEPHPNIREGGRYVDLTLKDPCADKNDSKSQRSSAALTLYTDYCERTAACRESRNNPSRNADAFVGHTLTVEWGSGFPADAEKISPTFIRLSDVCPTSGWKQLLENIFYYLPAGNLQKKNLLFEKGCFYHPVIRAEWLLDPHRFRIDEDALLAVLKDRTVLVGAAYTGQTDTAASSVFGDVPGVFLHAMALDNLITRGADFLHPWPSTDVGGLGYDGVVELTILAASASLSTLIQYRRQKRYNYTHPPVLSEIKMLAFLIFSGTIIGLIITVSIFYYLNLEPVNWIGIFLSCLIISTPTIESIGCAWKRYVSKGD